MKRLGTLIAALAAVAFCSVPVASSAADRAPPISAKQREQGKAEAPAAVQAAKLPCTVTDAYLIQSGQDAKKVKVSTYEVACQEGLGYMIQVVGDQAQGFDCLAQAEAVARDAGKSGQISCRLEANADPKAGLAKALAPQGIQCAPTGARIMGATAAGDTFYELSCQGDQGYVVQKSPGKELLVSPCIQTLGQGATECTLTTKQQILAGMSKLASGSGKECAVSNARLVGKASDGSTYYEVACGDKGGFMVQANAQGAYQGVTECRSAQNIGGGCEFTVVDETAEAGTYTKLAQAANYPCEVAKYRVIGKETKSNSEIVELACKNRPDGAIALFPIDAGKAQVFDCVHGGSLGVTCQLSQPSAVYAKYTEKLAAQGKNQCKVSGAKYLASTESGADFIETACSDGLPGFVISIDHTTGQTKELLTCGQVGRAGAACTLPTNVAQK